jgi:hypothetical protein
MGAIGSGGIAALCIAIAIWLLARKKSKVIAGWFALIAGLFLGGMIGNLVATGVGAVSNAAGSAIGGLFGVGAGVVLLVLAVIVCLELWHGLKPGKGKGKASTFTVFLALAAPMLLVAAGGLFADVVGMLTQTAGDVGESVTAVVNSG